MELKPEDLVINSWSGVRKSGWSVEPDTGVSLLHRPTGAMVQVNTERSQHANKAIAMRMLEAKVKTLMEERARHTQEHRGAIAPTCSMGVGTGEGNLFVYGTYESIKAAQALVLKGGQVSVLRKALEDLLTMYVGQINSGDCGKWNPEEDEEVIQARAALKLTEVK